MKRRRCSRSRKSYGPATSSRSGEPIYPHRPGEIAASSYRYGGRASYASAAPERMHHQRSEGGWPSPGEETTVRPKWRQKKRRPLGRLWIPTILLYRFNGNVKSALKAYAEQEGAVPALLREAKVQLWLHNDSSSSSSSRRSGDAQEEAPFDSEETSLRLKMDKKQESTCFKERGKIAQDEDEDGQSDKKPCPAVEDEQHSGKIGVHAIEEQKQEQAGSARGQHVAFLNMDDQTIRKKIRFLTKRLDSASPERRDYGPEYEEEQLIELYKQLALYRIRAYELTADNQDELEDANLKLEYPSSKLYDNNFFEHYEKYFEWYFDLDRCKNARFDNYQRLVVRHGPLGYLDWDFYRNIYHTYEQDLAYVQYIEEVAKQTKWVEDYMGDSTIPRDRIKSVAYMQALDIAAGFPDVSLYLISQGFNEYFYGIFFDYSRKGLDGLYFEIWKRVAKGKMSFEEALLEMHSKDMFPLLRNYMKRELENTLDRFPIKDYYDVHVAGIDKMTADAKARQLIREAVVEIASSLNRRYYLDYAKKKLEIAREIKLIPKGRRGSESLS